MIKDSKQWKAERKLVTFNNEALRHILEECAELGLVTARLMADKEDAHPVAVIREIVSIAGFLEAFIRRPEGFFDNPDPDALTVIYEEALNDYASKLDMLKVANPTTLEFVRSLIAEGGD